MKAPQSEQKRLIASILAGAATTLVLAGSAAWIVQLRRPVTTEEPALAAPAPTLELQRRPLAAPPLAARPADLEPNPWIAENNRAARLLGEGEIDAGVEVLESCYIEHPENDTFRRNLGEALVRQAHARYADHRLPEALASLERALALDPQREDADRLEELCVRWQDESAIEASQWTEDSSLFELAYDGGRFDILENSQAVIDHLESAYDRLREWFGRDPVREGIARRLRVVLYRPEEFDRLTGLGDWAGGAFDGVVRISLPHFDRADTRWKTVLDHELVHAFVRALGGGAVPGWLNEGLAQVLEGGAPDLVAARERLRAGGLLPLERLEGSLAGWEHRDEILRAYSQSLLIVSRIRSDWGDELLRRMVFACAAGSSPRRTFEAWAGVQLEDVLEDLLR